MFNIHILKLEENKYYICKSRKFFNDWTEKYPIVEVEKTVKDCDFYDIDKYTKIYMNKYGIENVRGGTYSELKLDENVENFLINEFRTVNNICQRCYFEIHQGQKCFISGDEVYIKNLNSLGIVMKTDYETISVLLEDYNYPISVPRNLLERKLENSITFYNKFLTSISRAFTRAGALF
jgi:hypothetical protein